MPLPCLNDILREEVRTHTDTGHSGTEPAGEILLLRLYASGHHNLAPRHRGAQALHELRSEHISRKDLAHIATGLLGSANFAYGTAARAVRHETTVAYRCDFRIEQRADNEVGSQLEIECCGSRIHYAAHTQNHTRKVGVCIPHQLSKHFLGEIAPVGELESTYSAFVAGLEHIDCNLRVGIVEHRHHTRALHSLNDFQFTVFCHCCNDYL